MGVKISNAISCESAHQIHSPKSCILLPRELGSSSKLFKELLNFKFLDFCRFIFAFVNMGPHGSKGFKGHLL